MKKLNTVLHCNSRNRVNWLMQSARRYVPANIVTSMHSCNEFSWNKFSFVARTRHRVSNSFTRETIADRKIRAFPCECARLRCHRSDNESDTRNVLKRVRPGQLGRIYSRRELRCIHVPLRFYLRGAYCVSRSGPGLLSTSRFTKTLISGEKLPTFPGRAL